MAKPKTPVDSIRFTSDFDHVSVERTVAYKTGDVVNAPTKALLEAAAGKFEGGTEQPAADGE